MNRVFFYNKPLIIKEWSPYVKLVKADVEMVPIWIRFYGLELKFWEEALNKIAGLVGKPVSLDNETRETTYLGYARIMVELKMGQALPDVIEFVDECYITHSQIVHYEWKPLKCLECGGLGHEKQVCKKGKVPSHHVAPVQKVWKPKPMVEVPPKQVPEEVLPVIDPTVVVTPCLFGVHDLLDLNRAFSAAGLGRVRASRISAPDCVSTHGVQQRRHIGQQVYLDALTSTTRSYKVKGNKMRGVLFGDQIEGHKEALVYNGVYEIANAPLKPCSDQYKRDPAELNYTMGFGHVVGIFMFVEEAARKVTTVHGRENSVREVLLVDHSLEQPIVVSTWNDLAENDCAKLATLPQPFTVLGFKALRISPHKGFSLTTTMSTDIDFAPVGPKAVALAEWVGQHKDSLRFASKDFGVKVPFADFEKVNAYLGCSHCGKRTDYAAGQAFDCENCATKAVLSEPRITFNFEVSDGTGTLDITTFTADTETFRMSGPEIFHMMHSSDKQSYRVIQAALQNVPFSLEVSPKTMLSRNNILQWGLRRVMLEQEEPPILLNEPPALPNEPPAPLLQEKNKELSKENVPTARRLDFENPPINSDWPSIVSISSEGTGAALAASTPLGDRVVETAQPQITTALPKSTQSPGYHAPTLLSEVVHECQVAKHGSKESTLATVVPLLKTPKVEKQVPQTPGPETPAQNAAKRSSNVQSDSLGKKKKTGSLNIGQ
ncbi:hypothetical protein KSS87_015116 [Heliosperma pusillum]|nr:hypothetical protein KSS87_015116 [Heliosperma pusillum]